MRKLFLVATLATMALPASAAEAPRAELFAGYSFARTEARSLNGWNASVAVGAFGPLCAVADASGHYGSQEGVSHSDLSLAAGPDLTFRPGGTVALFAHALFGLVRESAGVSVLGLSITEEENRFGMLFGGGVNLHARKKLAVRIQADYRLSRKNGVSQNGLRLSAGVVYRLGHR